MLHPLLFLGGLVLGLAVGRWWALAAAVAIGVWIASSTDVDEVPPWFLGVGYGVLLAFGIVAGIVARRWLGSSHLRRRGRL